MGRPKKSDTEDTKRKTRPALSPEAREAQVACAAVDLAEKQILEGTASSAVITHYLRVASTKYKDEVEKLRKENELLRAKANAIDTGAKSNETYQKVLEALGVYRGHPKGETDNDEDIF